MWALDIEEVRAYGRPKPIIEKQAYRTIRYPTQTTSLQDAVDQATAGDLILITPGIYNEFVEIRKDLTIQRESSSGEVIIISRFETPMLIDGCHIKLHDLTLAVEEGSLLHHALECDNAIVEMSDCEMYGGLYAIFAHRSTRLSVRQCKFHNAYSVGANIMNSTAEFEDSYFFKNREDENSGFGVHVHNGASFHLNASDVVKNLQAGISVTGFDEHQHQQHAGSEKFSDAEVEGCRIAGNLWQAVLVLDGSLKMSNCDPRGNIDGALTLSCSKSSAMSQLESAGRKLDVSSYNQLDSTGKIVLENNIGLRENGETEIYFPSELPLGWQALDRNEMIQLYKLCPTHVQIKLHGYPEGFTEALLKDPQVRIRIVSLFKKWVEENQDKQTLDELEFKLNVFLKPLGLEAFLPQFAECKCHKLRDIMAFTDQDLSNLGINDASQRKLLLHRVSSVAGMLVVPRFMKQTKFGALIDATKLQADRENRKARYKEWRKYKDDIGRRIGVITDGEDFAAKVKALFNEIDADGSASLDHEEIVVAVKRMGLQVSSTDVAILFAEADVDGNGSIDFNEFTLLMTALLRG